MMGRVSSLQPAFLLREIFRQPETNPPRSSVVVVIFAFLQAIVTITVDKAAQSE